MGVVRAHLQMKQGEDQEADRRDWGYMRKDTEGESILYTVACISKGSFLESATAVWPKSPTLIACVERYHQITDSMSHSQFHSPICFHTFCTCMA
jgi:hypothetical protein